jgi:dTDP-4-amino-4,6-dideoxygalactose transaminase
MSQAQRAARGTRETFLPYAVPSIGDEEIAEVVDSLRSGWVTTGPKVKRFESLFADYVGTQNAIAVNSCTGGLHIALAALDVGPGDEVIVPTLTFCATANVVVHLGAKPVLVDIGSDFNVDPDAIAAAITPRTKAVMPVHYGGRACDLDKVYEVAAAKEIPVIEDAAHAIGTTYRGRLIGSDDLPAARKSLRRITVFSFYATKNMTTGEGGMITTADPSLAARMRILALHGMSRDAWKRYTSSGSWEYEVVAAGYKYNMTDIQAAIGIHQLGRLAGFIETRRAYAKSYNSAFHELREVTTPMTTRDRNHVYHVYPLQLDLGRLRIGRAAFIEELRKENIGTSVHFIPVHLHPYYQERFNYRRGQFPHAEAVYDRIVSLPLYPRMTQTDIHDVIRAVRRVVSSNKR